MENRFSQRRQRLLELKVRREGQVPPPARLSGKQVFEQCPGCGQPVPKVQWVKSQYVCPHCGHHRPLGGYLRLSLLLDPGTFQELEVGLTAGNPLDFPGYDQKLSAARRTTGQAEAVVAAKGKLCGIPLVMAVMDSRFFMGSMGVAVGEKIARAADTARRGKLPLVIFCASGGARMQEGILSLMQMAKTAQAIQRFQEAFTLRSSPIPPPGGSPPALPPWETSPWPSRGHSLDLQAPGSLSRPSGRNCPRDSSGRNTCWTMDSWTGSFPGTS